jgi:hypothetical protein
VLIRKKIAINTQEVDMVKVFRKRLLVVPVMRWPRAPGCPHSHLTFAALFLLALAVMSLAFFRLSSDDSFRKTDGHLTQKGKRNRVYTWCGWIMIASVVILGIYFLLGLFITINIKQFPIIFTFETIAG